ncbi:MAG: hypothetical protein ACREBW_00320, partial [Candidatus Micrarchaeaceae archaeon]
MDKPVSKEGKESGVSYSESPVLTLDKRYDRVAEIVHRLGLPYATAEFKYNYTENDVKHVGVNQSYVKQEDSNNMLIFEWTKTENKLFGLIRREKTEPYIIGQMALGLLADRGENDIVLQVFGRENVSSMKEVAEEIN